MTFHEPSPLEVWITVAAGTFARPVYSKYVDWMSLQGHERVLDFGSGAGTPARLVARKLLKGGGQVTCVDVSQVWLKTARKRLARYPNVAFKLGESRRSTCPTRPMTWCWSTLCYMTSPPQSDHAS